MKEVKKGNKIPFHGYLLNMTEYQQYQNSQKLLKELIQHYKKTIQTYKENNQQP